MINLEVPYLVNIMETFPAAECVVVNLLSLGVPSVVAPVGQVHRTETAWRVAFISFLLHPALKVCDVGCREN